MNEVLSKRAVGIMTAVAVGGVAYRAIEAEAMPPADQAASHELLLGESGGSQVSRLGLRAIEFSNLTITKPKPKHKLHFTGYKVEGATSTFGPPDEPAGQTADGGTDARPCIAIRNDSTLDHMFRITVLYKGVKHQATVPQCDWGPGIYARSMDVSGYAVEDLKPPLGPHYYPTGAWGTARELGSPTKPAKVHHRRSPLGIFIFSAADRL